MTSRLFETREYLHTSSNKRGHPLSTIYMNSSVGGGQPNNHFVCYIRKRKPYFVKVSTKGRKSKNLPHGLWVAPTEYGHSNFVPLILLKTREQKTK